MSLRAGPITATCSPAEGPDAIGFIVTAKLPPLPGSQRATPWFTEVYDCEAEAQEAFRAVLREGGLDLHSIGIGERFPGNFINWITHLSAAEIQKALETSA